MNRLDYEELVADAKDYLVLMTVRDKISNIGWNVQSPLQKSLLKRIDDVLGENSSLTDDQRPNFANLNVRLKHNAAQIRITKVIRGSDQPNSTETDDPSGT